MKKASAAITVLKQVYYANKVPNKEKGNQSKSPF